MKKRIADKKMKSRGFYDNESQFSKPINEDFYKIKARPYNKKPSQTRLKFVSSNAKLKSDQKSRLE